jgi:hypothetical protein
MTMSRVIELSDEEYDILQAAAAQAHETPEEILRRLVRALATEQGKVYGTTDEMFAALDAYAALVDSQRAEADQ